MRTFEDRRAWEPQCPVQGRRAATTAGQGLRHFLLHDEHRSRLMGVGVVVGASLVDDDAPVHGPRPDRRHGEAQKPARLETF